MVACSFELELAVSVRNRSFTVPRYLGNVLGVDEPQVPFSILAEKYCELRKYSGLRFLRRYGIQFNPNNYVGHWPRFFCNCQFCCRTYQARQTPWNLNIVRSFGIHTPIHGFEAVLKTQHSWSLKAAPPIHAESWLTVYLFGTEVCHPHPQFDHHCSLATKTMLKCLTGRLTITSEVTKR